MKKKHLLFTMLLALATAVTACGSSDDEEEVLEKKEQVTPSPEQDVFEAIDLCNPNTVLSSEAKKALARVKVNISYELLDGVFNFFDDTRLYIRSVKCSGFALRGSMKINNTSSDSPVWKDYDGEQELSFTPIVFHDGRKDGKEGSVAGEQSDEPNQFLNPVLTENYAPVNNGKFSSEKNSGVNGLEQPLFEFCIIASAGDGYYYVIPRHQNKGVDLDVTYCVETIDAEVPGILSDGETQGILVENNLNKSDLLGKDIDFEPGKSYLINIVLGAEGPKIETVGIIRDS